MSSFFFVRRARYCSAIRSRVMRHFTVLSTWILFFVLIGFSGAVSSSAGLVFVANTDARWELFEYRTGQPPSRLVEEPSDVRAPAISVNSGLVAYITSDGSLWVSAIATRQRKKLASRFTNGQYGHPTWLNDDELAYTTYVVTPPTEDSDIYVYSFKQRKQRLLVKHTGSQDFPSVSRSGEQIAYMSSVTTLVSGFGATTTQQLWIASLRTGQRLVVSADGVVVVGPGGR